MSAADDARAMGLQVGDTIEGTLGRSVARLTMLWIGQSVVVWSVTEHDQGHEWTEPRESASWTLECRDWRKVEA